MKNLTKPFVLGLLSTLVIAGILFAAGGISIPTGPAPHDAYLHTFSLGAESEQTLTLDSGNVLIIPDRLIIGDGEGGVNTIEITAGSAVIGGGAGNTIGEDANNSAIGAGRSNRVFSKNAVIGAGRLNRIEKNAD